MSASLPVRANCQCNSIKNDMIHVRINSDLKKSVEKVFDRLGLTISESIILYLSQVKLNNGIPFAIKIPNETTLKVFAETDKNKNVVKAKNVHDIFIKAEL